MMFKAPAGRLRQREPFGTGGSAGASPSHRRVAERRVPEPCSPGRWCHIDFHSITIDGPLVLVILICNEA